MVKVKVLASLPAVTVTALLSAAVTVTTAFISWLLGVAVTVMVSPSAAEAGACTVPLELSFVTVMVLAVAREKVILPSSADSLLTTYWGLSLVKFSTVA